MPNLASRLRVNLASLRAQVRDAQARGPHAAPEVQLLAVTKSAPPSLFAPLQAAGVQAVGENRLPAALERRALGPSDWVWHGIGHLQRNKARDAVAAFDVFHALDSRRLASHLDRLLGERGGAPWPVYLQVNAAEDPAKAGVEVEDALPFLEFASRLGALEILGFMTMARHGGSEADARATFRTLRGVRDEAVRRGIGRIPPNGLSMGMTNDFGLAVEEGATIIRVGRAIFTDIPLAAVAAGHPETKQNPLDEDGA